MFKLHFKLTYKYVKQLYYDAQNEITNCYKLNPYYLIINNLIIIVYLVKCRYLRCENRRFGCPVSAQMGTDDGARINISSGHIHSHEPAPRHAVEHRSFMNRLRERSISENISAQIIVDQEAHM